MPLRALQPQPLWTFFYEITQIPHPSEAEAKLREHMIAWSKQHNFKHKTDKAGNLVIQVPASPGCEKSPTIVIQGHIDMVPQKNPDSKVDPRTDPLDVYVDGEWVKARGTTLGADNGIGVACGMAAAIEKGLKHGPLELLCTVEEETALYGASQLQESFVEGRILLNIDGEDFGEFYIGCAGGEDTLLSLPVESMASATDAKPFKLAISGLQGGHSGMDILKNRANAIKMLGRMLFQLTNECNAQIASVQGGSLKNAIPRDAEAVVLLSPADAAKAEKIVADTFNHYKLEHAATDPKMNVTWQNVSARPQTVYTPASIAQLIQLILALPNGVTTMSTEVENLPKTSINIGVLKEKDGKFVVINQNRFTGEESMLGLREQVFSIGRLAGAKVDSAAWYPSWTPNPNSELLKVAKSTFEGMHKKVPGVKAVHGGLECAFFYQKLPGVDMISFGPIIQNPHSPDEQVNIPSVEKAYNFIKALLERLA